MHQWQVDDFRSLLLDVAKGVGVSLILTLSFLNETRVKKVCSITDGGKICASCLLKTISL
jgi:hypothetical protein